MIMMMKKTRRRIVPDDIKRSCVSGWGDGNFEGPLRLPTGPKEVKHIQEEAKEAKSV